MHLVLKVMLGLAVASPLPAMAYTAAEAKACMPDAFRLCSPEIPDHSRVAACLLKPRGSAAPQFKGSSQLLSSS
jgi:hypothetical protein